LPKFTVSAFAQRLHERRCGAVTYLCTCQHGLLRRTATGHWPHTFDWRGLTRHAEAIRQQDVSPTAPVALANVCEKLGALLSACARRGRPCLENTGVLGFRLDVESHPVAVFDFQNDHAKGNAAPGAQVRYNTPAVCRNSPVTFPCMVEWMW